MNAQGNQQRAKKITEEEVIYYLFFALIQGFCD